VRKEKRDIFEVKERKRERNIFHVKTLEENWFWRENLEEAKRELGRNRLR
jgi:hypothetical protein